MENKEKYPQLVPVFQDLEQIIGKDDYDMWLRPATVEFDGTNLTILLPNEFWGKTIRDRYEHTIKEAFLKHIGVAISVIYQVAAQPPVSPVKSVRDIIIESQPVRVQPAAVNPFAGRLNSSYTFENFIESPSNRFAYKAAQAVTKKLGSRENNPLVIFSSPGLGKTHLLHAIGNQISKDNPSAKVLYMSGEEFVSEYIESLQNKVQDSFRKKCRTLDCFLMDDIQFVSGKDACIEEFFNTFNALFESGKQIVLSSDRTPQQLEWNERLSSRLLSGITTEIKRPNLETRIAILRQKRDSINFDIGDDVLAFIAEGIQTSVRELEGSLFRLMSYCGLNGVTPSIPIAKELLSDMLVVGKDKSINVNAIKKIVGKHFNIRMEDFNSKRKTQSVAWPRQIAMFLTTDLTDLSLSEIGREFNRDHSTIVHARDIVKEKIDTDPFFAATINQIILDIKTVDSK
ncbi:chromosomal replication initiator protein DnaA [Candidatus Avelusimicrobium luingense]|uniref:chromosomal replication initiator protein DnaA n=1 Tax=Candidatus Avelusimicrobium luingense TaxID=3416211 RepID=UPI003D12C436